MIRRKVLHVTAEQREMLGLDDSLIMKDFGRERGMNPTPSATQMKEIEKLASRIGAGKKGKSTGNTTSSSAPPIPLTPMESEEELIISAFDIRSRPRVLLFDAPLQLKNPTSLVNLTNRRHGFLLNDVMLLTSSVGGTFSERVSVLHILALSSLYIRDPTAAIEGLPPDSSAVPTNVSGRTSFSNPTLPPRSPGGGVLSSSPSELTTFEVCSGERKFIFAAESESDKKIWLEELQSAIFAYRIDEAKGNGELLPVGWEHQVVRGTLHSAAFYGEVELLAAHIHRLKYLAETNSGATTPIELAMAMAQHLDSVDSCGMTPLHWAALNGHAACVEELVAAGASVDCLNHGLNSPLLLACSGGHKAATLALLDANADTTVRNLRDLSAVMMTAILGTYSPELVDVLWALRYRGIDLAQLSTTGMTALHEAAVRGLPASISALVEVGADINAAHVFSGLTALQMSCSGSPSLHPDAETIRLLLECGAHPNSREGPRKLTALELILDATRKTQEAVRDADTTSENGLRQTVDDVMEFVQYFLPALVEIVRKGGRFTPESLASLRGSFQEVLRQSREAWKMLVEPEGFADYVRSCGDVAHQRCYVSDSASQSCILCADKFTYNNRRHHCRVCGVLCCDECSTKRMSTKILPQEGGSSKSTSTYSSKSVASVEQERVCDCCFNSLSASCNQWQQAIARAKKEAMKMQDALQVSSITDDRRTASGSTSQSSPASPMISTANDTKKALEERGQKIAVVAAQSDQMLDSANEFRSLTKQLLQQQKERAANGFF